MGFRYLLSGLLLLMVAGSVSGNPLPSEEIRFYHLTDQHGLSQRTVRAILHDSEGYMWFGTHDGLNKYNGYEIEIYRHDPFDTTSISFNEVLDIFEDRNQNLWIATGAGLNRYDRDKDRFIRFDFTFRHENDKINLSETTIFSLTDDRDGNLWIATEYGVILLNHREDVMRFIPYVPGYDESTNHQFISELFTDSRENIWIGTTNGLYLAPAGEDSARHFRPDPDAPYGLSDGFIQTIREDSHGDIWIGTQNGGLNRFRWEAGNFISYKPDRFDPYSISGNSIHAILEDSHGTLWIGTENEGLNVFDREQQRFYQYKRSETNPYSLNNNAIYYIHESDNQILWIGTYNGGLNLIDRRVPLFEHYTHRPYQSRSLSINSVTCFLEDRSGNIWVGTDGGGLNLFDRDNREFTVFRHIPDEINSIPGDVVLDLTEDDEGHIWIATYRNGFSRFNPRTGTFRHYRHDPENPHSPNHNDIFNLYIDPANPDLLWAGTNGRGVNLFDIRKETFVHYVHDPSNPESINQNNIRHFHRDSRGVLRIGNYGGHLVEFEDENEAFHLRDISDPYFLTNVVQEIFEDSNRNIWLATWGSGLKRYDPESGSVVTYTEKDGLPNNNIHGILEDDNGYLWLSSNNGLSRFDPVAETFHNFGIEDDLQSREFNPRAALRDRSGYLYFGGVNGFNRFHPDSLSVTRHIAPVALTGFRIFNEPVSIGSEDSPLDKHINRTEKIVLSHKASVLTFDYASLNYNPRKNIQYAYKLEGFDEDWNFVGNMRSAGYTNLSPGEYRFRVVTTDGDRLLNEMEASVALVITPPFWRTTWFYVLSGLFIAGLAGGFYRARVYNIAKRNIELEQEVAAQTRDLQHTLDELKSTRDQLVEKAHKAGMADMATNVLHDIGNILNSVNTSAGMINDILKRSQIKKLKKANELLHRNMNNLNDFICNDPNGKALMEYYLKLEEPILDEYERLQNQGRRLVEKIELITDVVSAQQNYASAVRLKDKYSLNQIVEDTLKIQTGGFIQHDITIEKHLSEVDEIELEKSKLVHVLINLLENAKNAIKAQSPDQKRTITVRTWQDSEQVHISITDTGIGIHEADIPKIFTHGFTTKKSNGHGFGLHSCANYINEMHGSIDVDSKGPGKGATFTVSLPRLNKTKKPQTGDNKKEISDEAI